MSGRLERADLLVVLARLLFIQATLNRKGMQNIGVLHALSAVASKVAPDPALLLARHSDHFNTNPNAAPVVIGAVLQIEEERSTNAPASVARFKQAACSALAAMGDVLVVGGLKPLALTLAIVSAIYSLLAGLVAILFLYNAALLTARYRGLAFGYQKGWGVVDAFTGPRGQRVVMLARVAAAAAGGVLIVVVARRVYAEGAAELVLAAVAAVGAWLAIKRGLNVARLAIALFPLAVVVAILIK